MKKKECYRAIIIIRIICGKNYSINWKLRKRKKSAISNFKFFIAQIRFLIKIFYSISTVYYYLFSMIQNLLHRCKKEQIFKLGFILLCHDVSSLMKNKWEITSGDSQPELAK